MLIESWQETISTFEPVFRLDPLCRTGTPWMKRLPGSSGNGNWVILLAFLPSLYRGSSSLFYGNYSQGEKKQDFQCLLDPGSEMIWFPEESKKLCGPPVKGGSHGWQLVKCFDCSLTHNKFNESLQSLVFITPVTERIFGFDIFTSWQNSHIGYLTCGLFLLEWRIGLFKWKPLEGLCQVKQWIQSSITVLKQLQKLVSSPSRTWKIERCRAGFHYNSI